MQGSSCLLLLFFRKCPEQRGKRCNSPSPVYHLYTPNQQQPMLLHFYNISMPCSWTHPQPHSQACMLSSPPADLPVAYSFDGTPHDQFSEHLVNPGKTGGGREREKMEEEELPSSQAARH